MLHLIPGHSDRPANDPNFALNTEATSRRAAGEHIVNATVGALLHDDGRLALLPTASRVVQEVPPEEWAAYAPIAGSQDFLAGVIGDLFQDEPELRASAVATATPGGSGALRQAITNFIEPGQALLTSSFHWSPYGTLCDESERRLVTYPMFTPDRRLDLDALDRAVTGLLAEQKRVLLVVNDPCHNPTGYSMQLEEWRALVERLLARAKDGPITLLVDVAYLLYGVRPPRAFLRELRPLLGKVGLLFAWSASKSFTHYGLRVGALVACVPEPKERAATEAALSYSCRGTWSNCSRGGMRAIARLLSDPALAAACDRERNDLRALLDRRVAAFNALAPARNIPYPPYEGGFFVTVFTDDAHGRAARMRERGVFVVPLKGVLRVALCSVDERDVARLVDALGDALR